MFLGGEYMIDFSPLEPVMDKLFWNLVIVLVIPLVIAIIVGKSAVLIKIPIQLSRFIAIATFMFLAYKFLIKVTS
jgi:hypothetical protein